MDLLAQSVRLGWTPSYPTFTRSSLDLVDEAEAAQMTPANYVVNQLKSGALNFAVEDPEAEENHPRILSLWRANLLGSSAKGNEYFLKHLLGTDNAVTAEQAPRKPVRPATRETDANPRAASARLRAAVKA